MAFFVLDSLEIAWEIEREGGLAPRSGVSTQSSSSWSERSLCVRSPKLQSTSFETRSPMPLRRVPATVGPFQKWAQAEVKKSKLSDSATGAGRKSRSSRRKRRKKRRKVD